MVGRAGHQAKSWLSIAAVVVIGVFVLGMPVQAKEYSIASVGESKSPTVEQATLPESKFTPVDSSNINNKHSESVLMIPRDDAAVNQFGIFYVNALAKRIEMIVTF